MDGASDSARNDDLLGFSHAYLCNDTPSLGLSSPQQSLIDRALLKRACTPQDIADVIVFLCVGTSMINGQTVVLDGGLSL